MKKTMLPFALIALAAVTSAGFAGPITDAEITAALTAYKASVEKAPRTPREDYMKAIKEAAEAAVGKLDLSEATMDQLDQISGPLNMADSQKTNLSSRLGVLAATPTAEGARAAILQLSSNSAPTADMVLNVFNHAGLKDALNAGKGGALFSNLGKGNLNFAAYDKAKLTSALDNAFAADFPATVVTSAAGVFDFLSDEDSPADTATIQKYRGLISTKLENAIKTNTDEKLTKRLANLKSYINGAYAKGELLNHEAPLVNFKWTNSESEIKSFNDLKGKVVVVDFWATWCGPCIGSFPQVRDLVAEYKGYEVAVVGITSIQGAVYFPKATEADKKKIDCKDDPAKEISLLPQFIKDMDMTWTIAVTDQDVFNPDFGVRGIPHVAIIDPAGKVRFRGLHPAMHHDKEVEHINALLKEFNLPAPAPKAHAAEPAKETK